MPRSSGDARPSYGASGTESAIPASPASSIGQGRSARHSARSSAAHGGSPALTLSSGDLTIVGATFVNDTPAPTILVTGGRLTLRDCTIEESTGAAEPAIEVDGGTIDVGTSADPGGNTLNVNAYGILIKNVTTGTVYAFGDHFTSGGLAVPPGPLVAGPIVWGATPTVTVSGGNFVYDEHTHPVTASVAGAGGVSLGAPNVTYAYRDDDGSWVPTANGGTALPLDPGYYRATAVFGGNDDYQSATATADVMIACAVRSLTDLSAAFKAGRTIPIKLQLLDANGINVSSPDIAVAALRLERVNADGTRTILPVTASGNANPENLFRYDADLGGYIFNLSTKDLSAGTYDFVWIAGDDPTEHKLRFSLI